MLPSASGRIDVTKLSAPDPGVERGIDRHRSPGWIRTMFCPGHTGLDLRGIAAEETAQEQLRYRQAARKHCVLFQNRRCR